MRLAKVDMFLAQADAICLTTNPVAKANGAIVMGRGNALYARRCWYGIDKLLGSKLKKYDGKPRVLCLTKADAEVPYLPLPRENGKLLVPVPWHVVSFPVKYHWREKSDLELIKKSCKQLLRLADKKKWETILLPRPGCGNGQLHWKKQVLPLLKEYFGSDDRIVVVHQPESKESNNGKAESNEEG